MKEYIYADNAATTKLDMDAFEAMKPFLIEKYGNASQPYSFSGPVKRALKQARETIAQCIGALPEEIFFTSGGTESNNWVVKGSALGDSFQRATITSQIEHPALLRACAAIERLGYPVVYLPVTQEGLILPETLEQCTRDKTRLVSIMFSNNEIGTIQPIGELTEIAHRYGALFHTDAVQSVGHIEINAHELNIDLLSASAHKFNGPKGVGFLYIRKGTELLPYADGGAQERGYRAGTENVAGIVGMAVALQKNCASILEHTKHLQMLEKNLIERLQSENIEFIQNGSSYRTPGHISLSFRGADGEAILHRLDLMGICVSTGSACHGGNTKISHVLKAVGLSEEFARGTIRITLSRHNSIEDVLKIADAIKRIVSN